MTPQLLNYLCDPVTKQSLRLEKAEYEHGVIVAGELVGTRRYPIVNGVPRFAVREQRRSVDSFGDQWNYFNFMEEKVHWEVHTVANTFGSTIVFRDKVIVDAGGGSGAQSVWMLESGAKHVILLELSHAVDDVVQRNTSNLRGLDVVQCSIDQPPLRDECITGLVICHNVIQHTRSVERTAEALFRLLAPGGEFVFNCYPRNDEGFFRWIRFHCVYKSLRAVLSRCPSRVILAYAQIVAALRMIPVVGFVLEKLNLCIQGDVPLIPGETRIRRLKRRYRATVLNTFDGYGSHEYQHHKSDDEIRALVARLQPDAEKIKNAEAYFSRPQPIGCALRLAR
jgi:SAM-dependent methyltransferase